MTKQVISPFTLRTYNLRQVLWKERNEISSKAAKFNVETEDVAIDSGVYQSEMLKASAGLSDADLALLTISEGDWLSKQVRTYNSAPLETSPA